MSLATFTEKVEKIVAKNNLIKDKTIKFAFDEGGVVFIDTRNQPNTISHEDQPADCVIQMNLKNGLDLLDGKLNVVTAFMFGNIKVKGDIGIAQKIAQLVG